MKGFALMIAAVAACTLVNACDKEPMAVQTESAVPYGSGNSLEGAVMAAASSTVSGDSSGGASRGGYTYGSGN